VELREVVNYAGYQMPATEKMGKDTLRDRKRGSGLISRATKEAESSVLYGLLKETVHTSYHDSFPGRRPQENDFQENFA
jgi:hypothetical protein